MAGCHTPYDFYVKLYPVVLQLLFSIAWIDQSMARNSSRQTLIRFFINLVGEFSVVLDGRLWILWQILAVEVIGGEDFPCIP